MNELLVINKEKNYTSRDIVNILEKKFNTKHIGHFGTLDPLATGVLVIGIGKYTKFQKLLNNEDKTYEVEVLLGTSTDTYDITGNVLEEKELLINKDYITETLKSFIISYNQEVPIYSATKINGKRLYDYARNNEKVVLPKKEVCIYNIDNISYINKNNNSYLLFTTKVSKGTYIRSLINDLSIKSKIPMCMSNLKRISAGPFDIKKSYTLEEINNDKYKFVDMNNLLNILKYKTIEVPSNELLKIKNGSLIDNKYNNNIIIFTINHNNYVAYTVYKNDNSKMKPLFFF